MTDQGLRASRTAHGTRAAIRMLHRKDNVLSAAQMTERLYLNVLMETADASEGVAAFLEKRRPTWTDR